ncbi:XTP/dITP diphosphatase [Longirhabdus pacifica]|uniref:XTP/dITP diphosphatase n=1 Tax=Longirhabdus pacifica TaxID=2305227 RepID=UPI0010089B73|nr:XTP/dITP diphosphatase [Longirhabdus pacifica]
MTKTKNEIIVATKNKGKVAEFEALFAPMGLHVKSLLDLHDAPEIIEDQDTFFGNAEKKARIISSHYNIPVVADDSGLCVDALDGQPGIYSARYAGEQATAKDNNQKLLQALSDLTPSSEGTLSTARFVCAMAYVDTAKDVTILAEGTCEGAISDTLHGEHGFGYDPLFYVPQHHCNMAQLTMEQKNKISHRTNALQQLLEKMKAAKI